MYSKLRQAVLINFYFFMLLFPKESKETRDLALRAFVQHLHKQWNQQRVDAISAGLEALVESSKVESKYVESAQLGYLLFHCLQSFNR